MKKKFLLLAFPFLFFSCNNSKKNTETILTGTATIYVDETLTPIIEDQTAVFEGEYSGSKFNIVSKSESDILNGLFSGKVAIAILARNLKKEEQDFFKSKKISPRATIFAKDALVLIANKRRKDTLINLDDIIMFIKGKPTRIKGLVFDNPNSSTVRYFKELAGVSELPKQKIFSFDTNEEVIKYISKNEGLIGVVGLNWIVQPADGMREFVDKINILSVKEFGKKEYFSPSQNDIAEGNYPLSRDLYIVNIQSFAGLGIGFASFITGDRGQRIILKSGLLPVRIPPRLIQIKKGIDN